MVDYYAILGLELGASPGSIKLAYRRLARECHPDKKGHLSQEAQETAAARMAELNAAYAVLSDPKRRREYDDQLRTAQLLTAKKAASVAVETPAAPRTHVRTGHRTEVHSAVLHESSTRLREILLSKRSPLSWRESALEGFDWALEASTWSAYYCVALRSFLSADATAARKFTNYADFACTRCRRALRKNFFLFLMSFQQLSESEQVLAQCRRFRGDGNGSRLSNTQSILVLLDVTHGRILPCNPPIQDDKFQHVLRDLGLARS